MRDELDAAAIRDRLGLEPHPTCGYVNVTFVSGDEISAPGPFDGPRPEGSALIFQVTPERPVHLHAIRNDQLYHRYLGDPLEVLLLYPDGTHAVETMGADLAAGHRFQLLIPGSTFHTARVVPPGRFFLGASTEWPGVDPSDVVIGDPDELVASHPDARELIEDFLAAIPSDSSD